jgi:hypothetical protein
MPEVSVFLSSFVALTVRGREQEARSKPRIFETGTLVPFDF